VIVVIPFPLDGKVVTYFIQFAKYQNRIRWGDCSLCKVVKDAIPARISKKLWYSKKDLSTFKGLKWAVLKIDSDYWRRISDDKQKQQTVCTLQNRFPKTMRTEQPYPSSNPNKTSTPPQYVTKCHQITPLPARAVPPQTLGLDGKLTPMECQRCMDLGLCLHCRNAGHLAKSCPQQTNQQYAPLEERSVFVELDVAPQEPPKKALAVLLSPEEPTA